MAAMTFAGCASTRRDAGAPRVRDEQPLEQEAHAAPQSAEPMYQTALLRYGQGDAVGALRALDASLGRDPLYAPSLALFAKLMHDAGRSQEAIGWFEKRDLGAMPDAVRLNVAMLYADAGNTLQARKLLQGVTEGAYAAAANCDLAYLDLLDDENKTAAQRLSANLGRYADTPEILNNVALARIRAGDVETGTRLLRDLAAEHPDFGPAQLNLALLLQNYLFDEQGAKTARAHFDALGAPRLDDATVRDFFDARHEDAAPPVPAVPAPGSKTVKPATSGASKPEVRR